MPETSLGAPRGVDLSPSSLLSSFRPRGGRVDPKDSSTHYFRINSRKKTVRVRRKPEGVTGCRFPILSRPYSKGPQEFSGPVDLPLSHHRPPSLISQNKEVQVRKI